MVSTVRAGAGAAMVSLSAARIDAGSAVNSINSAVTARMTSRPLRYCAMVPLTLDVR
jgi:hypothetical protein